MVIEIGDIKISAPNSVLEKFKQIVLIKHGKLEISVEGEEALKLYIQKYKDYLEKLIPPEQDTLNSIIGVIDSKKKVDALEDLKRLDAGEL